MGQPATVFIVDDDANARESLAALVKSMGLEPICFASAEDFCVGFSEKPPHCLVTDLRMPGMGGLELQKKLNQLAVPLPCIVITAYAETRSTVKAMQSGAVSFLEKTCSEHELCESISNALAKSEELSHIKNSRESIETKISSLNQNEKGVLKLLGNGKLNKQAALELNVSTRTIEVWRKKVMQKLEVDSFAELMRIVVDAEALDLL